MLIWEVLKHIHSMPGAPFFEVAGAVALLSAIAQAKLRNKNHIEAVKALSHVALGAILVESFLRFLQFAIMMLT